MKIVADSHIPNLNEYFSSAGDLILKRGRDITNADVRDADMLLVRSITEVDERLLANSKVKFVGSVTAGADHLDTDFLARQGIDWSVAKGFNAPPVADYVLSVIAGLQRTNRLGVTGMKAAVIGVGNVGRLVAERLKLLNFQVLLCDPIRAQQEPDFLSTTLESIADVDLISLHVPLTKTGNFPTYHFIDKNFLQKQKPGAVLLNASRGSVIDTKALLEFGKHLQWCFDVWAHEPKIDKNILQNAIIATPHIAGYSVQSKIRGIDMIYHIALEKNIIPKHSIQPVTVPRQRLDFSGARHHWQDILLGIFNPFILTNMMHAQLLTNEEYGLLFDEMRNHFNYRHEFAYTDVVADEPSLPDVQVLERLGLRVN